MIVLKDVNKYFNRRKANEIHVINHTSLEFPDNGIVALLGPSGCGKTTLLNAIGGLDRINSGQIYIDGDSITRRGAGKIDTIRNAKIGYIFQNFNLLDDRTVFDNVAIALRMVGIKDKNVIKERVNYCLDAVGIYTYRNKTANALSGGQRQRVAIARAIVKNPRIIIADEPTGNLDSANTIEVMNIIKTISKERLVILVTHEKKIAEFYADRIIDLKDGKIVGDRINDNAGALDYQLENKIYLKDQPYSEKFRGDHTEVNVYSDSDRDAKITMVLRGGNLYISTGGAYNVVDENSNIEMIDDHYTAMDASIYEDNAFQYDRYMPDNFKAKYTSLYTFWNMLGNGFRSIRKFRTAKKVLLLGFLFAAGFTFMGISNILGVYNVEAKDFLTTNGHYITVTNPARSEKLLNQVRKMDGVSYVIPGNSRIQVTLPMNDYYQTASASASLTGSITHAEELTQNDLVRGRLPKSSHEIVIDKLILDKFIRAGAGAPIGLKTIGGFIGRTVIIPNLKDYTIVGVSDTNSPSIFFEKSQTIDVLASAPQGTDESARSFDSDAEMLDESDGSEEDSGSAKIVDLSLASDNVTVKSGRRPEKAYEVMVNNSHREEDGFTIGKTINRKVNGHNLMLVGFYTSDYQDDIYYVDKDTVRQNYIAKQKVFSVYANDTDSVLTELDSAGLSAKINYDRDRETYVQRNADTFRAALVVAGIILLVSLIEMFLMLRSSFLSRIKEVGTMRAIGLKKRDIYRMFTGEIIVITALTGIPGIAISYYVLSNMAKASATIAGSYMLNPMVAGVTFIVLLLFNLLAGLLPVFRTMRKTPAAILARTDIQ